MKIAVQCTMCKTPHFDHYECDKCHAHIPWIGDDHYTRKNGPWKFCPWCGASLEKESEQESDADFHARTYEHDQEELAKYQGDD